MQVIYRKPLQMKATSGGIIERVWYQIEKKGEDDDNDDEKYGDYNKGEKVRRVRTP